MIFIKFIDKFTVQNEEIWTELISDYKVKDLEKLKTNLHKLSGIATTMGADGYFEILHEAYSTLKTGGDVSQEEFQVMIGASKDIEKGFIEIKEKWQKES